MIEGLLIKVGVGVGALTFAFVFGYFKGKGAQRNKQLKKGVTDALKTQKRRAKRRNDTDDTVTKRMRKYTRR